MPALLVPVFAALVLVVGLPGAVLLARRGREAPGWGLLAVEGLLLGLGWYLLAGLVLAHAGALGRAQLLTATVPLAATLWWAVRHDVRALGLPRLTPLGVAMAGVLVLAVALRGDPVYFLYQTADFGEYVNRANVLAGGGPFIRWFLHLFSVCLALSTVVAGQAGTVAILPFLGLVLLVVVVGLVRRLGLGSPAQLAAAGLVALGPVPVWFSQFPASESLYAVLQVAVLYLTLAALQRSGFATAAAAGAFAGLCMLTRGNALLLAGLIGLAVVAAAVLARPRDLRVAGVLAAVAAVAMYGGFAYNARYSDAYFLHFQLPRFLPGPLYAPVSHLDRALPALAGMILIAAVAAAVVASTRWLARRSPQVGPRTALLLERGSLGALVAGGVVALGSFTDASGLWEALGRFDPVLLILAGAGLAVLLAQGLGPLDGPRRVTVVFAVSTAVAFAVLFAHRIGPPREAPYHLYWERYLYSELYPVLVLLAGWAVAAAGSLLARTVVATRGGLRLAAGCAVALASVGAGLQLWGGGALAREHTLLDGAYEQVRAIDRLAGERAAPIVFTGVPLDELPPHRLHPNTFRLFAYPLFETFGREVLNIHDLHPADPDPVLDPVEVVGWLRAGGYEEGVVVAVAARPDRPWPGPGGGGELSVEHRGRVEVTIPVLARRVGRPQAWRVLVFWVDVLHASLTDAPVTGPPPAGPAPSR